jgi:hypothetical protein
MSDEIINEKCWFGVKDELTAKNTFLALKKFDEGMPQAIKLEGDYPIVLDANILLGYYGMSQKERRKLIKIIEKYKERIYITRQIEKEYLKNRIPVINQTFFEPLNKIPTEFLLLKDNIKNKIKSYSDFNKKILIEDYPSIWEKLYAMQCSIEKNIDDMPFYDEAKVEIEKTTLNNGNIILKDEMLELVASLKVTDSLIASEMLFVKTEFDKILILYNAQKEKSRKAFPGCGDKKQDASGDFIIFHELTKFIKSNLNSCIFLTNDVTKGDWLLNDGNPHIHYVENNYLLTSNIIFIINGARAFNEISFENIHKGPLELLSAIYGTGEFEKNLDVTSILKERISENKLTVRSFNDLAGDPHPGTVKKLTIKYRVGEDNYEVVVIEGETITIPESLV